ncbi:MAG: hypothetical protein Q8Q49_05865 [bacterium]|nr:hypothetical protein [bacterium]
MYDSIIQLPRLTQDRTYFDSVTVLHEDIFKTFSITDQQFIRLAEIEEDILLGKQNVGNIIDQLKSLSLDEIATKALAKELLCRYFYLFQDFLGNITEHIIAVGGDLKVCETNARAVLQPRSILTSFARDFFTEVDLYTVDDMTMGKFIDSLLEAVESQMTNEALTTHLKSVLPSPNNSPENLDYIVYTWIGAIQTDTITKEWAWYYRNLADNVINAGKQPLYDQPILPFIKEIWDNDTIAYHVREYCLLRSFSHLSDMARKTLVSEELKQHVSILDTKYDQTLLPYIVRTVLDEISYDQLVSTLRKELDVDVEAASAIYNDIIVLIKPLLPDHSSLSMPTKTELVDTSEGKLPSVPAPEKPAINYDAIIDQIIPVSSLPTDDPALISKVRATLLTRLRGIRDAIETRESLNDIFQKAGKPLDTTLVALLIKEANTYALSIATGTIPDFAIIKPVIAQTTEPTSVMPAVSESIPSTTLASPSNTPFRARSRTQTHPQFGVSGRTQSTPAPTVPSKPRFAIEEVKGVPMIVEKSASSVPMVAPVKPSFSPSVNKPATPPASSGNVPIQPVRQSPTREIPIRQGGTPSVYRVPLNDVKVAPRLMDGIEELRSFTLKDFRRLSSDPQMAVKSVYQKIKLLEKDSASKKVAGINAWKESEVHRLYATIGQESFGTGKRIGDIMTARATQNKPNLSEAEFDALMELNEMLRF